MQRRNAPATSVHHAVPHAVQVSIRRHSLVRRLPKRAVCRSPHRAAATRRVTFAPARQYRFPAWRSCRSAPHSLGRFRGRTRTV